MPKVGGKHFSYSERGKKAAKDYAKESGQEVEKYYGGGKVGMSVDPFSTKNPEGVPTKQIMEAIDKQNVSKNMQDEIPTSNAMERSQTMPDTEQYKDGGKVKSTEDYMKTDYKKYEEHHQRKIKKKAKAALEGKGNIIDVVKATEASKEDRDWYIPRMKMLDAKKKKKGKKK